MNYYNTTYATYQKTLTRLENNNISKLTIKNCLISWKNDAFNDQANLMWSATNSPNLKLENTALANIANNSTVLTFPSASFFDNYDEFDGQKYLFRKSYFKNGRLITAIGNVI